MEEELNPEERKKAFHNFEQEEKRNKKSKPVSKTDIPDKLLPVDLIKVDPSLMQSTIKIFLVFFLSWVF